MARRSKPLMNIPQLFVQDKVICWERGAARKMETAVHLSGLDFFLYSFLQYLFMAI